MVYKGIFYHYILINTTSVCPEGWNDFKGRQCIFKSDDAINSVIHTSQGSSVAMPCRTIRHSRWISVEEKAKADFLKAITRKFFFKLIESTK